MKTEELEIVANEKFVAYCGLYCGACRSYLSKKCPGCHDNVKASWCEIRKCCTENNLRSCADCTAVKHRECKKYNNFFSKVIGFILNSDRGACIDRIRETGYHDFAVEMAENKRQTIRKRHKAQG